MTTDKTNLLARYEINKERRRRRRLESRVDRAITLIEQLSEMISDGECSRREAIETLERLALFLVREGDKWT